LIWINALLSPAVTVALSPGGNLVMPEAPPRTGRRVCPSAPAPVRLPGADPIGIVDAETDRHLVLCDQLESLADRLGERIDLMHAENLLLRIQQSLSQHVRLQETFLFPVLRIRTADDQFLRLLSQVEYEHSVDQSVAVEMSEAVTCAISSRKPGHFDALGYLFRSYFESSRRHSDWERKVIHARADELLTDADRLHLAVIMLREKPQAFA
jgi:hypothetical protein